MVRFAVFWLCLVAAVSAALADARQDCTNFDLKSDVAIKACNEAILKDPKDSSLYVARAGHHGQKGDLDRAIVDFTQAIKMEPRDADTYKFRGMAFREKNEYDRALADFNKAIEINPAIAEHFSERGYIYHSKKEYERAISDYNKALEIDARHAFAYAYRGRSYLQWGYIDHAIADFRTALEIKLDDRGVEMATYLNLAKAYEKKGDKMRAIDDYRRAYALTTDKGELNEIAADLKRLGAAPP